MAEDTKRCASCGEARPRSEFGKQQTRRDGRDPYCKACRSEKRKAEREWRRAYNRAYRAANRERIIAQKTAAERADPEKYKAQSKASYERHRERRKAASLAYQRANRAKITAWRKAYYAANPERAAALRAYHKAKGKRWRRENPERVAEYARARRRLEAAATVVYVDSAVLAAKWDYWAGRCWMCGGEAVEWDHVKPLSQGGPHMLANLRPACRSCNATKQSTWPLRAAA